MTPQLRFPEFTDKWQVKRLGDIAVVERGASPRPISKFITNSIDGLPWIKIGDVAESAKYVEKTSEMITAEGASRSRKVRKGGFILSNSMSFGRPYIMKIDGYIHDGWLAIHIKDRANLSSSFLYEVLGSQKLKRKFKSLAAGSTVSNLKSDTVKMALLHVPEVSEQEKIAGFLTAVDERIGKSEKKLELLKQYKKGVMQKIFTQKIRFKDENGKNYPDWQTKKLGDIFDGMKGSGLSLDQITEDGVNKCILYGELYTKYQEVINGVLSRTNTRSKVASKKNDLLIPCSTTTTGIDLANATALNEEGVLLGGDISVLRFKKYGSNIFYAYYLSHFMKYKLAAYGQGSTIVHMYFSHFKNMKVFEPSLQEQHKIADFLMTIDDKIKTEETRLTAAKQWKKGLLQRMFV